MTCSFCGVGFDEASARLECAGCLAAGGCRGVRCPTCGYDMPEEIKLLGRLSSWWRRGRAAQAPPSAVGCTGATGPEVPLAALRDGETATVSRLFFDDPARLKKLLALGILPGVQLTLLRHRPMLVFRVDLSQLAIDERLGEAVRVRRAPGDEVGPPRRW